MSPQPFVDGDHALNSYFLPREYALILPAAAALVLLLSVGQYRSGRQSCGTVWRLLTSTCGFQEPSSQWSCGGTEQQRRRTDEKPRWAPASGRPAPPPQLLGPSQI